MIFADINFGQKGQIPGHMDGQISHITKMCSFQHGSYFQMTSNQISLVLL
jgi:hypothetical protein